MRAREVLRGQVQILVKFGLNKILQVKFGQQVYLWKVESMSNSVVPHVVLNSFGKVIKLKIKDGKFKH
jgi:hypothetical protein